MSDKKQERIINLQAQLKSAKAALAMIAAGCRNPESVADHCMYEIWPRDRKQPLQGLVGHERRTR